MIFKKYGIKFVVIGMLIPCISMMVTLGCLKIAPAVMGENYNLYEVSGLYSGAMTSTPAYDTALDVVGSMDDVQERYLSASDEEKSRILALIDAEGTLTAENTVELSSEQVDTFLTAAKASVSLGYTVTFPVGVIVIILCITFFPNIFRINVKKENEAYQAGLLDEAKRKNDKKGNVEVPFNLILFSLVMVIGIIVGSISIPLGPFGSFSLGAAGGVLIMALVFSYVGKIGKLNFRMETKTLVFLRELGLTFFMAVVGLTYGYNVVNSFAGSGLTLALMAIAVEALAVLVTFLVGRYAFKLNWVILSGAICGGCTSAPGLGAAISTVGNDEPSTGYGAAQPFAILANVILISIFHRLFFI